MRLAAIITGAIAATVGLLKAGASYSFALAVGIGMGNLLSNSFLRVVLVCNTVLVLFCGLAVVGALLAGRGRDRAGVTLFLLSAAGVVAAALLYVYLFAAVMTPMSEVDPGTPTSPNALFYWTWIPPAPLLLIAAALLFYSRGGGDHNPRVS